MEVYKAIQTMLAVRGYRDQQLPDDVVKRIVEAARLTGSSRNTQGWDFVVVRDRDTLQKLGELASTGPYIGQAQLAVAVVVPDTPTGYIDGTRAAQDMMLAAWGEGVGSNWVGNVNKDAIKSLLNVPGDRMILTIIPFGYPAQKIGKGKKNRKPLTEVAHAERYGESYSG